MKKGFTVVELIVSFSLTMLITTFLFQLVIGLKNLYENSGLKTELLNKQSLISKEINEKVNEKGIYSIAKCGSYCLNFIYNDNSNDKLILTNDSIEFGSYKTTLPENSYFKNVSLNIAPAATFDKTANDSILILDLPIYNDKLKDQNFGIKMIYQFKEDNSNIYSVEFDESSNNYGYIVLKGEIKKTIEKYEQFVDDGYIVYDNNGNEIINSKVVIDNPFDDMENPYKTGEYNIIYKLYDEKNNLVEEKIRKVIINPTKYQIVNLIIDGNMENTGWNTNCNYSTEYVKFGNYSCRLDSNPTKYETSIVTTKTIKLDNSHIYYTRVYGYTNESVSGQGFQVYWPIAEPSVGTSIKIEISKQWQMYSYRFERNRFESGTYPFRVDFDHYSMNNGSTNSMYYDGAMLIDLTESFGAGNEPSKEWCDNNINYFEDITTVIY